LNPRHADAHNNRGLAYQNLGQYQRAIQDYDEAIRLNPRHAQAYFNRGINRLYLQRDAEAERDFGKAFELDPGLKRFEPLITEAKAKRKRQPAGKVEESAASAFFHGLQRQIARQYREAIAYYDKAIQLNPRDGEVYFHRGTAYAELRQYQRAIQDYNDAIRLKPGDALAYDRRGVAYAGLGQYERAIEDYNDALRVNSRYAWAYGHRGLAWLYLQRDTQAESDLKKAFELDPFLKSTFEPLINEAKTRRQGRSRGKLQ
jgi:tetratricopeptide (TPR) repeat protein